MTVSRNMARGVAALALLAAATAKAEAQVAIGTYFVPFGYMAADLGPVSDGSGTLRFYGGLTFLDSDTLLLAVDATSSSAQLFTVPVTRDVTTNHIMSFGTATLFGTYPGVDGGVHIRNTMGGNVLFTAHWAANQIGQTVLPGSVPNSPTLTALGPLGVAVSSTSVGFVPAGIGTDAEGRLKVTTIPNAPPYDEGSWYDIAYTANMDGTVTINGATQVIASLGFGPEQFVYVEGDASPVDGFAADSLVIADFDGGIVAVFDVDDNGDPLVGTRRDFVTGLFRAEGVAIDPVTGDFLLTNLADVKIGDPESTIFLVSNNGGPPFEPAIEAPVPASALLLLTGLLAVAGARRRGAA